MKGDSQVILVVNKIWLSITPPRPEILTWFVLWEKLNTREGLCSLGILQPVKVVCPLYLMAVELWPICFAVVRWHGNSGQSVLHGATLLTQVVSLKLGMVLHYLVWKRSCKKPCSMLSSGASGIPAIELFLGM